MPATEVHHITRIAPTPSGFLHLGNILAFSITEALAKRYGAQVLLRIDDLDHERAQPAYVQDIFDTLHFLSLPWQLGPRDAGEFERDFSQLRRLHLYNAALDQLTACGLVFACTCSRSQVLQHSPDGSYPGTCRHLGLPLDTPGACWRMITDNATEIRVPLLSGGEVVAVLPRPMKYFMVRKKDGYPAYQLSSVVDDVHFGCNVIVRGQDLWESTMAQLHLASQLGFDSFLKARFYHHPLLLNRAGLKMSKSAGDMSVQYLRQRGCSAGEIFSILGGLLRLQENVVSWEELSASLLTP